MLDRQKLLLDEYGAFVPLDQIDMRSLIYITDSVVKERLDRKNAGIQASSFSARRK